MKFIRYRMIGETTIQFRVTKVFCCQLQSLLKKTATCKTIGEREVMHLIGLPQDHDGRN